MSTLKPILDGPTHHGFDEFYGVTGNTEDPLDTEPRILIRNDRFTFTDRSRELIGMKRHERRIFSTGLGSEPTRSTVFGRGRKLPDVAVKQHTTFFFYAPNANHFQRNPHGDYAVRTR